MKKILPFMILVALLTKVHSQLNQQGSLKPFEATKALIETGSFLFEAVSINPRNGPQISLVTNDNYLMLDKGKVTAHLPYFGIARAPDYGGSGPIIIDAELEKGKLSVKKKRFVYRFRTNGKEGVQDVTMNIRSSGWTTVLVRSVGRPSVSYYGKIQPLKKDRVVE